MRSTHMSWGPHNSAEVFERATEKCNVITNARVTHLERNYGEGTVTIKADLREGGLKGPEHGVSVREEQFDRVVLACNAHASANIIKYICRFFFIALYPFFFTALYPFFTALYPFFFAALYPFFFTALYPFFFLFSSLPSIFQRVRVVD